MFFVAWSHIYPHYPIIPSPSCGTFPQLITIPMDRIEPAEDGNSRGSPPDDQSGVTTPPRPALATVQQSGRPRAPSARSRRPSIRLSRLPSLPSLDTENFQTQPETPSGPPLQRQVSIRSPVAEEDESAQSGRRRSNSEPRPGRYSGTSSDVLSRVATPMRMGPLAEESSRSPLPTPQAPAQQPESDAPTSEEAEEPQHPVPRSMLRRTSQAALRPFTRNRASTVTGAPPQQTIPENAELGINEYGPHVVDVLDVIGKLSDTIQACGTVLK